MKTVEFELPEDNFPMIIPYDLKKGDIFTVRKWTSCKDGSWVGDLFSVESVIFPYVFAKFLNGHWKGDIYRFDARKLEFASVSDEYIEAVLKTDNNR